MTVHVDDEEKHRRGGYSTGSSKETTPALDSDKTAPNPNVNKTLPGPSSMAPDPNVDETLPVPNVDETLPVPNVDETLPVPSSDEQTPAPTATNELAMPRPTGHGLPMSDPPTNPPILLSEVSSESPSPGQMFGTTTPVLQVVQSPGVPPPPPTTPQTLPSTVPPVPEPQTATFERRSSCPAFITTAVFEHLNAVDGGPSWVEMIKVYLELEGSYPSRVSSIPYSPFFITYFA